ncbi:hypothetical protein M2459_000481 [Parabacteroides sp. PF5-5]|uniref:DUF3352 domain-containing protein n=1 Tax=unclassified Parabacteroides TaxID=2649774 RepID=UPI00247720F8|nr:MULTISPECIES: DUF3352 domain-containing protein [unclassified Parabacteroides]MDH6303585.1 hypothetical protein [Parabacteroides sp. PH5-39]MDH6314907.1 hypothetical protein [Parabacteroides sp. PF5-13]MDH6318244.1 hypothetical protein [Parabacteroides sp. PH5-13]MDH6321823.1 hypothetical protein [Parabacteroides sp. PH5-8]MDH6325947.1 hypothetical protein [Parabacteroides sp. PH5-41]
MEEELTTKKKNITGKILITAGIVLALYLLYSVGHIFLSPDRNIQQIYLIPEDAAFIIQSASPVDDWKTLSNSEPFKALTKAKSFEEITRHVEMMDSVIRSNKTMLSLVGKRDMLISIHKTRGADWDFLLALDMQKTSKLALLKNQIELVLKMTDFTVTNRTYNGINILEMRDPQTREILYGAFVDNHFIASYTSKLVEASIDAKETPKIGLNPAFIEADRLVANKGLYRIFINYANLPSFLSIYLGGKNEYIEQFANAMDFAGLYFQTAKDKMETKGYTLLKENADPYVAAMLNSGKQRMKAQEILSARTALFTHIGLNDLSTFVRELERILSTDNQALYTSYTDSKKRIEKLSGISLDEHFLSWMSGEFAITQLEPGLLGSEPELILAIGTKDIDDARRNMDFIEKKIKSRTPIKVKTVEYKGFEVNYVEMKGFFRLFFGGIFDSFEKPYYTFIDDYVIFSNKAASLLSFIEDYEQKNLLKNDPGFKQVGLSNSSTFCLYADMHKFYPQLRGMLNNATWSDLQANKELLYSFPYWAMQISGEGQSAHLHHLMTFKPYEPQQTSVTIDSDEIDREDSEMNEDAQTEKEIMSELKRFYVEKFQGNVLREFYADGQLQSESEVKDGKRHGRYREYYENGKLRVRGKFVNNRPKGTWKYYTEEGSFERKEKF